ncbi:MAG: hypothetical protein WC833_08370 [Bacteroidales bacterium]|jgi:hypothetical protein
MKFNISALLVSRLILFAFFQAIIALLLSSWTESQKYWILVGTIVNIVSICLLVRLQKNEGKKFLDIFRFDTKTWRRDLLYFTGMVFFIIPLAMVPNYLLGMWLWSDPAVPSYILFQQIPDGLAYVLLVAFPITIAFAELATYFGYIMPRLEKIISQKWLVVFLPAIFLSVQHCCLPLVFDYKFIIYRGLVFFPFALFLGYVLRKKPGLLPFLAILHGFMDMAAVSLIII